jgi:hypothetical protein
VLPQVPVLEEYFAEGPQRRGSLGFTPTKSEGFSEPFSWASSVENFTFLCRGLVRCRLSWLNPLSISREPLRQRGMLRQPRGLRGDRMMHGRTCLSSTV